MTEGDLNRPDYASMALSICTFPSVPLLGRAEPGLRVHGWIHILP